MASPVETLKLAVLHLSGYTYLEDTAASHLSISFSKVSESDLKDNGIKKCCILRMSGMNPGLHHLSKSKYVSDLGKLCTECNFYLKLNITTKNPICYTFIREAKGVVMDNNIMRRLIINRCSLAFTVVCYSNVKLELPRSDGTSSFTSLILQNYYSDVVSFYGKLIKHQANYKACKRVIAYKVSNYIANEIMKFIV